MRALLAALTVGLSLAAVPVASASLFQPGGLKLDGVQAIKLAPMKWEVRTCTAQSKSRSAVAKVSRRVHPVACEQPPRSNALDGAFVITFAP